MCFTIGILSLLQWTVDGRLRIGFFTLRFIPAGDELTFDYQFQRFGLVHRVCVFVCVCVHVCECVCVCMCVCLCACLSDRQTCTHRHTDSETHRHTHTYTCCLPVSVSVCTCMRVLACVRACIQVYMQKYTCLFNRICHIPVSMHKNKLNQAYLDKSLCLCTIVRVGWQNVSNVFNTCNSWLYICTHNAMCSVLSEVYTSIVQWGYCPAMLLRFCQLSGLPGSR